MDSRTILGVSECERVHACVSLSLFFFLSNFRGKNVEEGSSLRGKQLSLGQARFDLLVKHASRGVY